MQNLQLIHHKEGFIGDMIREKVGNYNLFGSNERLVYVFEVELKFIRIIWTFPQNVQ